MDGVLYMWMYNWLEGRMRKDEAFSVFAYPLFQIDPQFRKIIPE